MFKRANLATMFLAVNSLALIAASLVIYAQTRNYDSLYEELVNTRTRLMAKERHIVAVEQRLAQETYKAATYSDKLARLEKEEQRKCLERASLTEDQSIAELKRQIAVLERIKAVKAKYGPNPPNIVVGSITYNLAKTAAELPPTRKEFASGYSAADSIKAHNTVYESSIVALVGGVHRGTRMLPFGPAPK